MLVRGLDVVSVTELVDLPRLRPNNFRAGFAIERARQIFGIGDQGAGARLFTAFEELNTGFNFGLHTARGKMALRHIVLGFGQSNLTQIQLDRKSVV